MQRRHIVIAPLLLALAVFVFKYLTSERFVNPETGRVAHVALSPGQEAALGLQSYQEVLSNEKVITQGPDVEMVQRVVKRLEAATGPGGANFEWEVSVVKSDAVNAFCLPGGKIVVYTGILPVAQSESGLAAVLGHEMAHATSRHGAQRLYQNDMMQTLLNGAQASIALSDMDSGKRTAVMAALGAGAKYGALLPFSRNHESEADGMGLLYMARAGYDPNEAIRFWQRMSETTGGAHLPAYLSTHPSNAARIAQLNSLLPKALEEYQKASKP